jgi:hypothetical protein
MLKKAMERLDDMMDGGNQSNLQLNRGLRRETTGYGARSQRYPRSSEEGS